MKRRRARRLRPSVVPFVALFVAVAVVTIAVALILRGDTTPRPKHAAARERGHPAATHAPVGWGMSKETGFVVIDTPPDVQRSPAQDASAAPALGSPEPSATPAATGPRLAIIIDDCGQWPDTERGFIALPVALTLSVLPHVRYGGDIARDARAAGKGVMLHLPMEPRSGADAGPGKITVAMDDDAIAKAVQDDLASVPLAAGVNNHEGSRATADDRVMRAVVAVLAQRRVFFIDSRTSTATVGERDATAAGVPTARRDVFLDDVADVDATEAQLRHAADLARARGSAIAIGHPRPTTLAAVTALLPELAKDGITLVLASELVH
jgi:polysaccharide deacetylase 2 family uncharacterized protein YibQ